MKLVICFVCLFVLAISATELEIPGPCVYESKGEQITAKPGDVWEPTDVKCGVDACAMGSRGTYVIQKRCDVRTVYPPCFLKTYPYKSFPECCPIPACGIGRAGRVQHHSGSNIASYLCNNGHGKK